MNNTSQYAKWESGFNACNTRHDYYQYYSTHLFNEDNPFRNKALEKMKLFDSYEKELNDCNGVEELEKYILKYIDTDNPYLTKAKTAIAEISKYLLVELD